MDLAKYSDDELIAMIKQKYYTNTAGSYVCNAAQANFIRLFGGAEKEEFEQSEYTWIESAHTNNFLNLSCGGNGGGKTDVECLIAGQKAGITDNPYFYDKHGRLYPFYTGGHHNVGRIVSNPAAIKDTIVPRLIELFPEGTYKKEKRGREYYCYFEGPRGRFDLMTYEQALKDFESITLGWCIFDEPEYKPDIFLATTARFRKGGKIGFVLTPLGSASWLYDYAIGNTKWTVGTVYFDYEINCKQHGVRGALEHEHLVEMSAGWDADEMEARKHGKWMHLIGRVYNNWDERIHVVEPDEIPEQGTIYCAMDPHTRRPNFMGWFKSCPNGRLYMIDEWPQVTSQNVVRGGKPHSIYTYFEDMKNGTKSYEEYCDVIRRVEDRIGVSCDRVMDGKYGNTSYGDGDKPYYKEFCERGVDFSLAPSDPYLYRGHNRVKALLRHENALRENPSKPSILPRLLISSVCRNTIKSFSNYIYDPKKAGDSEAVSDKWKDPMDVVRMASERNDWRYRDPQTLRQWRTTFSEKRSGTPAAGLRISG